jgi:uncharacterized protein with von Willebrand factor type A (vWA) domain
MAEGLWTRFSKALRGAGVRVSPAETLDALRVVELVGYEDRARLKQALSLCLAKSATDKAVFDAVFDQFFSFAEKAPAGDAADTTPAPVVAGQGDDGSGDNNASEPGGGSELGELLLRDDTAALETAVARAADSVGLERMTVITQRGLYARRVMLALGVESLDQEIAALAMARDARQRLRGEALRQRRDALRDQVLDQTRRQFLLHGRETGEHLRERTMREVPLSQLNEFRDVRALVQKMARRLVAVHSRRQRRAKRGVMDARRTLRESVRHDGVPLTLHWRRRRRQKPRLYVVCDVSRSVSAAARFLMMFLQAVNEVLPRARLFAFSSSFGEVTDCFHDMDADQAVDFIMQRYGGAGTDYGNMLVRFKSDCQADFNKHSTVIILGDARNNELPSGNAALRDIHDHVARVFWLNPEAVNRWDSGDSIMSAYLPWCRAALPVRNLDQLERFVDRLLREMTT